MRCNSQITNVRLSFSYCDLHFWTDNISTILTSVPLLWIGIQKIHSKPSPNFKQCLNTGLLPRKYPLKSSLKQFLLYETKKDISGSSHSGSGKSSTRVPRSSWITLPNPLVAPLPTEYTRMTYYQISVKNWWSCRQPGYDDYQNNWLLQTCSVVSKLFWGPVIYSCSQVFKDPLMGLWLSPTSPHDHPQGKEPFLPV